MIYVKFKSLFLQLLTCSLFLSYGILLNEKPIIIANSLVLLQSFILCIFKYIFSNKNKINPISIVIANV